MFDDMTYTGRGMSVLDALYSGTQAALGAVSSLASAGGALLGLNTTRVARMVVWHEGSLPLVFSQHFSVLFNPSQVTLSSGCSWQPKQHASPGRWSTELEVSSSGYQPATLSMELMFDTTDEGMSLMSMLGDAVSGGLAMAFSQPTGSNVLSYTQNVARLAQPSQDLHRPPVCQLWWGPYMLMQGVLTSCSQTFKLWKPDGTPVRASMSVTFTEFKEDSLFEFFSPDVEKSHVVRRGDTLPQIAATYFGDASKWWVIAQFNNVENARALEAGTTLRIPALER